VVGGYKTKKWSIKMARKNETQTKDLQIENETIKVGETSATLSVLQLLCDNRTNKMFRVLDDKNQPFMHRSTRLGTLLKTDNGLKVDITGFEKEVGGKKYELVEVENKNVIMQGKILAKAASLADDSSKRAAAEKIVNITEDKKVSNG